MSPKRTPPLQIATRPPMSDGPRIEITPTSEQYTQLCHDLAALRRAGAISNTAAMLAAVREAAARLDRD
jgi:hypothetical protein